MAEQKSEHVHLGLELEGIANQLMDLSKQFANADGARKQQSALPDTDTVVPV